MRFKLHFQYENDGWDFVIVEGETIPDIQRIAKEEIAKRNPVDYWSEEIND